jgi:SAM-dependent methyltransferase
MNAYSTNAADQATLPFRLAPAKWRRTKYRVGRLALWQAVTRLLPEAPTDEAPALDVGCGLRPFDVALVRHGFQPLGVDRAHYPVDVLADIEAMPFKDGSFPLVLCINALQYLRDPAAGCSELFRILQPGGAAIVVLTCCWPLDDAELWRWTAYGGEAMLRRAGFASIVAIPVAPTSTNLFHLLALSVRRALPVLGPILSAPLNGLAQASLRTKDFRFPPGYAIRAVKPRT